MPKPQSFLNPLVYDSKAINHYLQGLESMRSSTHKTMKGRLSMFPDFDFALG